MAKLSRSHLKSTLRLVLCGAAAGGCTARPNPARTETYPDLGSYLEARARLVERERSRRLSSALVLSPEEEAASRRLEALRKAEYERVGSSFPPAHSFLLDRTRRLIEESPLLEVMRRLPKGGILHVHRAAGGDFRWLVSQVTERADSYVFVGEEGPPVKGALRFFPTPPEGAWCPVKALRDAAPDPERFDEELLRSITFGEEDREVPDIWVELGNCFRRIWDLFADDRVYTGHWRLMLDGLIDENAAHLLPRLLRGLHGLGPGPTGAQAARPELTALLGHGSRAEAARARGVAEALGGLRELAEPLPLGVLLSSAPLGPLRPLMAARGMWR